jgi:hypothetical protein
MTPRTSFIDDMTRLRVEDGVASPCYNTELEKRNVLWAGRTFWLHTLRV